MKTGMGFETPAAPATVSGELSCHMPLGSKILRRRHEPALTRKPGDLPVVVVFRADRVFRADGGKPE
jgi:hypothetical protein